MKLIRSLAIMDYNQDYYEEYDVQNIEDLSK